MGIIIMARELFQGFHASISISGIQFIHALLFRLLQISTTRPMLVLPGFITFPVMNHIRIRTDRLSGVLHLLPSFDLLHCKKEKKLSYSKSQCSQCVKARSKRDKDRVNIAFFLLLPLLWAGIGSTSFLPTRALLPLILIFFAVKRKRRRRTRIG